MTYAFRVDSSTRIGTGHLVRCLTLAKELRSRGEGSIFLCQHLDGNVISQVLDADFEVLRMDINSSDHNVAELQDATEFLRLIRALSITSVIVDHYDLSLAWEEMVGQQVDQVMVIDDFVHRQHHCDLLLNQNLVPPNDHSFSISQHGAKRTLIGPKYALLQQEYALLRSIRSLQDSAVERISVFMGGSDPDNITELVVHALLDMGLKDIAIDVVVGSTNPHRTKLQATFEDHPSINFHSKLSSLAPLLNSSNLAIGAGGTTNWERMCLGVPSVVVDIAENQREICVELARVGLIEYIGSAFSIEPVNIQNAVEKLCSDQSLRRQFSCKGQVTVDGFGANRVVETLLPSDQSSLSLRNGQLGDITLYFNWVNDSTVRQNSINSEPITWLEHQAWFLSRINNPDCRMFVICAGDLPIGQVRLDKSGETWTIDYSLDEFVRGRGWGKLVVGLALAEFRKSTTAKVVANVKSSNSASRRIFQELNFSTSAHSTEGAEQFELII